MRTISVTIKIENRKKRKTSSNLWVIHHISIEFFQFRNAIDQSIEPPPIKRVHCGIMTILERAPQKMQRATGYAINLQLYLHVSRSETICSSDNGTRYAPMVHFMEKTTVAAILITGIRSNNNRQISHHTALSSSNFRSSNWKNNPRMR